MKHRSTYLNTRQVVSEADVGLGEVVAPSAKQSTTHVLIKVSGVSHEGRRQEAVTDDRVHLSLERLRPGLPTRAFTAERLQKSDRAGHLLFDVGQVSFDGLSLKSEQSRVSSHIKLSHVCFFHKLFYKTLKQ